MRDLILTAIIFSTIPFIFKRPYIGVLVLAWLGYMNPHRMTWGFAYHLPFSNIIALVTFAAILFSKDIRKLPFQYSFMHIWLVWVLWMNLTTLFAFDSDMAFPEWLRMIKVQMMALLSVMLFQSKEKIILLVVVIAFSAGFYGFKGGVFTILTAGNHMVFGPMGTFFEGNNALAIALLMVTPLMWFLQAQTKSKLVRLLLYGMMFLCLLSVIASYSRGAFLAFATVLIYFFLKSRKKLIIVPFVVASVVLILFVMPEKYFDRLNTIQTYEEDRSAMGRINAWHFAFNVAKENPLTGGGFGGFQREFFYKYAPDPEDFHDAHSIYFEALGEHGFVGLVIFLILGLASFRMNASTVKKCRHHKDLLWASTLAKMLPVSLVGYAVGGLFLGITYFDLYYHLLALTLLVRLEVDKRLEFIADNQRSVSGESRLI